MPLITTISGPHLAQVTNHAHWGNATTTVPSYTPTFTPLALPDNEPAPTTPVWALVLIGLAALACLAAAFGYVWAARKTKTRSAQE